MFVVLLGAPGAGKGTQAVILAERLGVAHVATGDMFREALRQGTELGLRAKEYMDRGQLVPDEITIGMLLERISRPDCQKGCLLDGFPRTLEQAEALDSALAQRGEQVDKVIYIKVEPEELVSRLAGRWTCPTCGAVYHERNQPPRQPGVCDRDGTPLHQRDDDKPETVQRRLDVYFQQTAPLIDYYARAGKLVEVDGARPIEDVTNDMASILV